jgi:hypothetical protein
MRCQRGDLGNLESQAELAERPSCKFDIERDRLEFDRSSEDPAAIKQSTAQRVKRSDVQAVVSAIDQVPSG